MTIHNDIPELNGAIHCILRDVSLKIGLARNELPSQFDTRETATILELTTTRTLDSWAARPDRGGLPFIKVGRSRKYLLSDLVTFIAERRTSIQTYPVSAIATVVCVQIERLNKPIKESAV